MAACAQRRVVVTIGSAHMYIRLKNCRPKNNLICLVLCRFAILCKRYMIYEHIHNYLQIFTSCVREKGTASPRAELGQGGKEQFTCTPRPLTKIERATPIAIGPFDIAEAGGAIC